MSDKLLVFSFTCLVIASIGGCCGNVAQSRAINDLQKAVIQLAQQQEGMAIALTEARMKLNLPYLDYSVCDKEDLE